MDDVVAEDLLEALQEVFRKHAKAGYDGDPYKFPPEWEQARKAIRTGVLVSAGLRPILATTEDI